MIPRKIELSDIRGEWFSRMPQALLYYWNRIEAVFQTSPQAHFPSSELLDQLMEGFWFGETTALHLYRTEDGWGASWYEDNDAVTFYDEVRLVRSPERFGSRLAVRYYLDYDHDGQAFVVGSRPLRLFPHSGSEKEGFQ